MDAREEGSQHGRLAAESRITSQTETPTAQQDAALRLEELFEARPLSPRQTVTNLALFMRAGAVAKILFLDSLYREILDVPGVILDLGTWLGGNAITFESLRAIHEPYNLGRHVVAFDTFSGYPIDGSSQPPYFARIIAEGTYDSPAGYSCYLESLLQVHEARNVGSHVSKHKVVQGDVTETLPTYLQDHPEAQVALAYFDLATRDASRVALHSMEERLMPGSVIVLDEFGHKQYPGETQAYRDALRHRRHTIRKSNLLPERAVITLLE